MLFWRLSRFGTVWYIFFRFIFGFNIFLLIWINLNKVCILIFKSFIIVWNWYRLWLLSLPLAFSLIQLAFWANWRFRPPWFQHDNMPRALIFIDVLFFRRFPKSCCWICIIALRDSLSCSMFLFVSSSSLIFFLSVREECFSFVAFWVLSWVRWGFFLHFLLLAYHLAWSGLLFRFLNQVSF